MPLTIHATEVSYYRFDDGRESFLPTCACGWQGWVQNVGAPGTVDDVSRISWLDNARLTAGLMARAHLDHPDLTNSELARLPEYQSPK